MKKALLLLSAVFALVLGGCSKPLSLEGTSWRNVIDSEFGGFSYKEYRLIFSDGGDVTLEMYGNSSLEKTVQGTYSYKGSHKYADLKGLDWEEGSTTYSFVGTYLGTESGNLVIEVKASFGTFSIYFKPED